MSKRRRRGLIKWVLIIVSLGVLAAIAIPNFLRFSQRSPHGEVREVLRGIYSAEKAFYQKRGRYGTFDEIGFELSKTHTRYTYQIDHSGEPGTVYQAHVRPPTLGNLVIRAGISPDGQHFTATAAANLDKDSTLDQWHLTDSQPAPIHDVDDRTS